MHSQFQRGLKLSLFLLLLNCSNLAFAKDGAKVKSSISILLDESGQAPFDENASAYQLAFFNLHVLGQLLIITDSLAVEPALLDKAEYQFDRKEYILKLRAGTKFHNGRIADSKDLEFSLLRGFFSKNRSFYKTYLGGIEGIDAVNGGFKSGAVRGVRVIDDLTIGVKLKHPNPTFLHSIAQPYFSLVARESLDDSYLKWKGAPVGAGPYRVVESANGKGHVRIEKFSKNTPGPEEVDLYTSDIAPRYDFSLIKTKKVDNESISYAQLPGSMTTLFLSRLNPLSKNTDFRKALTYSLNREEIAKVTPGSKPSWEMLPSHFWGRTGEKSTFDLKKAKEYFNKIPEDLRNKTWKFHAFYGSKDISPRNEKIISQLKDVGFKFEYRPGTEKFISNDLATEIPLFVASQINDFTDPLIAFAAFLPTGHDPYLTFESDPEFESAYEKAAFSITQESRVETIKVLSRQLNEKIICVPLLERKLPLYFDSKRISKVKMWGTLGLFKLEDVEFKE